ncbi:protein ABSCISIC ACID-INSENSITIVE 5 isoform X2 [Manihot esculenta]|uniref:Uncharacterized protein n=4 Tax=Manihot esculenta TaxID=3983 RepID=A0ACB7H914_MANES|nr:protein ABSCISIC ACID-INSENSITIVE 5 isoform X2 [Manihot esculenta]KAG8648666.1 hypothetical protein MANES_08G024700v8 [Manihot esculenta]KAG8648667.1 hypothetical protein MANES_08G024700v8 [Manihot esculenta]KAG8648668.1 hypothetical protein MANES_08G024700v8 [Manihot esculenta]KAG8648669.1 hypothetical protein MANES_08G024700v8 [Manihot esculenta]
MVVREPDEISQGEVESPLQSDHHLRNPLFSSLGRQSSIYSLTLDEFQHTLCESGKNFGSMNMDEFLASIWNAEEHQATAATSNSDQIKNSNYNSRGTQGFNDGSGQIAISTQPSLPRQGSLSLPEPLCRKTVDEVWSEIHREQQQQQQGNQGRETSNVNNIQNPEPAASRRQTFGEMTLEDFLVKAGVVREQCPAPPLPTQQRQYGLYQSNNNNNPTMGTSFVSRPFLGIGSGGGGVAVSYQTMPQEAGQIGEVSGRNGGLPTQAAAAAPGSAYGGRVGNGGGYPPSQAMGVMGQVSPVTPDGLVDNAANQFGIDMSGLRGGKRIVDGPKEKVVERRQRRMIKNRESAARSRARKQAYTVELEAELNQLKEENMQLRQSLAELENKRKQQYLEESRMKVQTKAQKTKEKLRMMRRNVSCPL